MVPYTNDDLLNGTGIAASPFVIAVSQGGIRVVPHIMNAVVVIAVISVGNSSVYGCSRTLASLAVQGLLPKSMGYIDRGGRPLIAILFTSAIGLLGFLVVVDNEGDVFTWFFSICSLSSFSLGVQLTLFICVGDLPWLHKVVPLMKSFSDLPWGLWSWTGILVLILIVIGEVWVSIWPIGSPADVQQFWKTVYPYL